MIDDELAELYEVETKNLNRAIKRNIERFPKEFMFQLTKEEYENLRCQFGTSSLDYGGRRHLPYVFTEQGVAMLSAFLRSKVAVNVSIQIMNAFVSMRKFISNNTVMFQRLDKVENKLLTHDDKFEEIFNAIESKEIKPKKGIFFEGEIFGAYKFILDVIRSADKSIILVDNYIDDSILTMFNKRKENVRVTIFTKEITRELLLDLKKYNSENPLIEIKKFTDSHDRFLIIDDKEVYHIGASLKDLGKKWFAFSKFDREAFTLLEKLSKF